MRVIGNWGIETHSQNCYIILKTCSVFLKENTTVISSLFYSKFLIIEIISESLNVLGQGIRNLQLFKIHRTLEGDNQICWFQRRKFLSHKKSGKARTFMYTTYGESSTTCSHSWQSSSVDCWVSSSCNFLIPCPILFKLSLMYLKNEDFATNCFTWGIWFPLILMTLEAACVTLSHFCPCDFGRPWLAALCHLSSPLPLINQAAMCFFFFLVALLPALLINNS